MSDEEQTTPEPSAAPDPQDAPDSLSQTDGVVNARWSVAVIPNENVSIHYVVSPIGAESAVTSVTTSFALMKDHMVNKTYGGSTAQELVAPKAGQGSIGDSGIDSTVFPAEPDGQLVAILSGTVNDGKEPKNFFFSRPFDPKI